MLHPARLVPKVAGLQQPSPELMLSDCRLKSATPGPQELHDGHANTTKQGESTGQTSHV